MKTKQFIKEIKPMGFDVKDLENVIVIIDSNEDFIAKVSKVKFGGLATDYPEFYRLEHNTKLRLLDLLIEYAKTPIEDRKEEEKYYYRLKGFGDYEYYLNLDLEDDVPSKLISGYFQTKYYQTQFTDAEFEALPEDIKSHNWEKIKVEREE